MTKMSNKTDHQQRIELFMALAGQEIPGKPTIPSEEVRRLRAALIMEEALETIEALGFDTAIVFNRQLFAIDMDSFVFEAHKYGPDLVLIADGCADISVVTIGTLSACGISDQPLLEEVDASNLRKFEKGSYRREDGKWIKPVGWKAPDIQHVLDEQSLESL